MQVRRIKDPVVRITSKFAQDLADRLFAHWDRGCRKVGVRIRNRRRENTMSSWPPHREGFAWLAKRNTRHPSLVVLAQPKPAVFRICASTEYGVPEAAREQLPTYSTEYSWAKDLCRTIHTLLLFDPASSLDSHRTIAQRCAPGSSIIHSHYYCTTSRNSVDSRKVPFPNSYIQ